MTVLGGRDDQSPAPAPEPRRIDVRWVVILAISIAVGFVAGNPAAGIGAGFAVAVALHVMMA